MAITYNKKVLELFKHPKHMGEIKNPDGKAEVGNPSCGDVMEATIKVTKDKKTGKEIIKDIKFKTFGCIAAIASSSMTAEVAKGKPLEEAEKLEFKDITNALKGLPPIKTHCSMMGIDSLKKAIENYKEKKKE